MINPYSKNKLFYGETLTRFLRAYREIFSVYDVKLITHIHWVSSSSTKFNKIDIYVFDSSVLQCYVEDINDVPDGMIDKKLFRINLYPQNIDVDLSVRDEDPTRFDQARDIYEHVYPELTALRRNTFPTRK